MWALGIILYQLVSSNQYPFNNEETEYIFYESINKDDPKPLPETVSSFIKDIISKLLDKIPKNRPDAKTILEREDMQVYI